MDTQTPTTTRRTTRRADKYRQESGVAPSADLLSHAPQPSAAPEPPPVMDRPCTLPRADRKTTQPLPQWLTAAIIGALVLILALFTAQSLMQAYLVQRQDERTAAFAKVVDAHPIYYMDLIQKYADENNLQPAFLAAIILNESSFRANAESSVGARGLMQLMPDTAEWIAGKLDMSNYHFDNMYAPEHNIRFGAWYLRYLCELFRGDPVTVASAYHAGQTNVTRWLSEKNMSRDGLTLSLELMGNGSTSTYARRVTRDYAIYDALYYTPASDPDPGPDADPS